MPWDKDTITRLIEVEAQLQDVDPRLAVALAEQENPRFDPAARSPKGAIGIMQLMPKTALGLKVDPTDVAQNVTGGITYLKQQLDAFGGDTRMALAAYNAGPGVVKAYGKVPPYKETQGYVSRILGKLGPSSAEASTAQTSAVQTAPPRSRLEDIEAELARREGQATPSTATPPTSPQIAPGSTITPQRDTQPPPQPDPSATPGMRFQALPSITQLEPADRIQKTAAFERLTPALQEEFLRSEEPAAGGLAMGGGPVRQAQPVTDPAALLAGGRGARPAAPAAPVAAPPPRGPASSTQIEPLQPGASELALSEFKRPHEQGIPLEAVPAIAVNALGTVGGAVAGSPLGPVGSAAGAALGGAAATRFNTRFELAPQEKPLLETPYANVYPSDLLGAIPLGIAGTTSALKGTVRNLPGSNVAKHEIAAERLKALEQRTAPPVPSDVLWQKAGQSNTAIATADVWRTAGDVIRRKSRTPNLSADDPALKAAQDLLSLAKKHGGPVPIQELDDARRNLVPHLRDPDVKRLYGAVIGDMDNAVTRGVPGAADLRGAIAATRKEHRLAELTDLWSDGKGMQKTSGDVTQVYGKRIQNQFDKKMQADKTFAGAFTPEELTDIRSTLRDVGKLTRITNPEAQGTIGSTLKWLGRLGGAGYGATSGDLLTGGMMILATEGASAVMANAMQSKVGRWALREAIREGNGKMTHASLAAIAALVAREAAPDAPVSVPTP